MTPGADGLPPMTPTAFIKKWRRAELGERQSAQEHFLDICALVGHPSPIQEDPNGEFFAFEKGANKLGGGRGFADVWKKGYFAWEYKRKNGNLDEALLQLMRYAPALSSPPLHIVCDIARLRIHTAWTNTVPYTYEIALDDLAEPTAREMLRNVFFNPEKLRPSRTRAAVTKEAADKFSTIALRLQGRGTPEEIAHFVNQLVFCFFAQSVSLLPDGLFTKLLRKAARAPDRAMGYLSKLFEAMERGGEFDLTDIAWFNGGLFDGRRALRLDDDDIGLLVAADSLDWGLIDPTIFGTLFERFLDPEKRSQIGAHYTDPEKIMRLVEPVILRPLRQEWGLARLEIVELLEGRRKPPMRSKQARRMTGQEAAAEVRSRFTERLRTLRILDPACGSGNFLYLALQGVKDIEHRVNLDCEMLGLPAQLPLVGPEILRGIEINTMAAELARTTIWIGDIQWQIKNGIRSKSIPILRKLDAIERRDALIRDGEDEDMTRDEQGDLLATLRTTSSDGEAEWPPAEFIVGNPPFLGVRLMRQSLGDPRVERLFKVYDGRVAREADLVCYWVEKSRAAVAAGKTSRVGLVTTNSIRGGANRKVLDQIASESRLFEAWSDEPWVVDGASVRVSLFCFGDGEDELRLDGKMVAQINSDLTAGTTDLTKARRLVENQNIAFMGDTKGGAFDVPGELARSWLRMPVNPNGRPNSDVLRPWRNGMDVTRHPRDMWIIDFGWEMSEHQAALYEAPFQHIKEHVFPERTKNRRDAYRERWWRHVEPRPALHSALRGHSRYVATPRVAKHRTFVWLDQSVLPDSRIFAFSRSDDVFFGILHSRFHEAWSLGTCSWHGVGNDPTYNSASVFETFPFPAGLSPDLPAIRYEKDSRALAISIAARKLVDLRNAWLNPTDLVEVRPEVVSDFPDRVLAKDTAAQAVLRERTLTNLYNWRPQWLIDAHAKLDAAVANAYSWPADISDEEAIAKLLELNLSREAVGARRMSGKARKPRNPTPEEARRAPQMKLPIDGGLRAATTKEKSSANVFGPQEAGAKRTRKNVRRGA
ncbi:class I SAM-dependent DNA methyltransferase [Mesorhizobium sp. CA6]|uniref:class I SAM-dependent DNA methyltransferase n=1 Tax=Mesorhizobium sp. CA6 TaxID=588500 RepID=UPI001CC9AA67|nr:class I SAM-dependent DNA methyltransferase [Mesorhizobium sp. CA6]MBZ9766559.1 class I SAM-dependent DNA methyltransferase [Mesorhizobium sp. CA6]